MVDMTSDENRLDGTLKTGPTRSTPLWSLCLRLLREVPSTVPFGTVQDCAGEFCTETRKSIVHLSASAFWTLYLDAGS